MRFGIILAATAALAVPAAIVAKGVPVAITKALADPARADQQGDDARRQAAAVLAFSGVKPGDKVVDLIPGSGYWTRIFTGIVGAKGHVWAVWPAAGAKYAEKAKPALEARNLGNVSAVIDPAILTPSAPVDLIWTVQNYHDVNNGGGEVAIAAFNGAMFKALKPGGTYIVIDHAAPAGSGLSNTNTTHRIDPAVVKTQVLKAGFVWVGESKVLANKDDNHSLNVFDPLIRGKTDQFVYKFRKPLK